MTDDELQDRVRDELFWDPRVNSDVIAGSANDGEVTMSTAKAKRPERVSRRRRAARARTSGRARRCGLLSPRSPTTGSCRTATPARWSLLEPV